MEEKLKNFLKQLRLNESLISTLLGVAVVIVVGILLYNYFSSQPSPEVPEFEFDLEEAITEPVEPGEIQEGETPKRLPETHQVVKGEHLWLIAETYFGSGYNWVDIAATNNLVDADQIAEGMELTIPDVPARYQTISQTKGGLVPITEQSITGNTYTVQTGDSLWSVAVRAYGDGYQWPKLYQENKQNIGPNPDRIEKGTTLSILRE